MRWTKQLKVAACSPQALIENRVGNFDRELHTQLYSNLRHSHEMPLRPWRCCLVGRSAFSAGKTSKNKSAGGQGEKAQRGGFGNHYEDIINRRAADVRAAR